MIGSVQTVHAMPILKQGYFWKTLFSGWNCYIHCFQTTHWNPCSQVGRPWELVILGCETLLCKQDFCMKRFDHQCSISFGRSMTMRSQWEQPMSWPSACKSDAAQPWTMKTRLLLPGGGQTSKAFNVLEPSDPLVNWRGFSPSTMLLAKMDELCKPSSQMLYPSTFKRLTLVPYW